MTKKSVYQITVLVIWWAIAPANKSAAQGNAENSVHFYSMVTEPEYDTLHACDFTWSICQPINDTISHTPFDDRQSFIRALNEHQKALFYIYELEGSVSGGFGSGFLNFYYNYAHIYEETIKGLTRIQDTSMLAIMQSVHDFYLSQREVIEHVFWYGSADEHQQLVRQFKPFTEKLFQHILHTHELLEKYIRARPQEFVRFILPNTAP